MSHYAFYGIYNLYSLCRSHVRQETLSAGIADGINAIDIGLEIIIRFDEPAIG